jgi:hypothetical protein
VVIVMVLCMNQISFIYKLFFFPLSRTCLLLPRVQIFLFIFYFINICFDIILMTFQLKRKTFETYEFFFQNICAFSKRAIFWGQE